LVISSPSRNTHCFHLSWPGKEVLLLFAENSLKSPYVSLPLQYHYLLLLFGLWVFELSSKLTQLQQLKTGSKSFKTLLSSSLLVLLAVWVLVHFFPKNKTAAENPFAPPFHKIYIYIYIYNNNNNNNNNKKALPLKLSSLDKNTSSSYLILVLFPIFSENFMKIS
jgi:hypothetical protein